MANSELNLASFDRVSTNKTNDFNIENFDYLSIGSTTIDLTKNVASNAVLEQAGVIPGVELFDSQAVALQDTPGLDSEDEAEDDGEAKRQSDDPAELQNRSDSRRVFRDDGSVEYSHDELADGSTQFTRYFEMDGIGIGVPEEMTTVSPDGSSEYRLFSPNGDTELLQQTLPSGDVATFTRQPDGTYRATFNGINGDVGEGIFDANLNPIETTERRANGEVNRVSYDAEGRSTSVTRRPDGSEVTIRREGNGDDIETNIRNADGSRTNDVRQPNGETLRQHFAPNGEWIGNSNIPAVRRAPVTKESIHNNRAA